MLSGVAGMTSTKKSKRMPLTEKVVKAIQASDEPADVLAERYGVPIKSIDGILVMKQMIDDGVFKRT